MYGFLGYTIPGGLLECRRRSVQGECGVEELKPQFVPATSHSAGAPLAYYTLPASLTFS